MASPRVVISGLGFVTSIGNSVAEVTESLRTLRSGIERHAFLPGVDLPVTVAGTLKGFDTTAAQWPAWRWPEGYTFSRDALRAMPPHGLYALCAVEQLIADARLTPAVLTDDQTGLFCASAGSARLTRQFANQLHESRGERVPPMAVVSAAAGTLNFNLAAHFGIRGAVTGFVSACASGTHAVGYACDEIRLGRQQRVIVVGGEDLTFETVFPFHGMRALSRMADPARASRPFDVNRDGFVATGGAAALVIEEASSAVARGAHIYAEVLGWGQAGDGFSVAQSEPEGRGLMRAMHAALRSADVGAEAIDYVNAHATSTPAGDASEARALRAVFTEQGLHPPVSSTKALTGHALSFSGAMELGFCAIALANQFVPGAAHLETLDPVCAGLNLPKSSVKSPLRTILKNSSGFGGSNVCVVLRQWEERGAEA